MSVQKKFTGSSFRYQVTVKMKEESGWRNKYIGSFDNREDAEKASDKAQAEEYAKQRASESTLSFITGQFTPAITDGEIRPKPHLYYA